MEFFLIKTNTIYIYIVYGVFLIKRTMMVHITIYLSLKLQLDGFTKQRRFLRRH